MGNVIITGAGGFLGTHLCQHFANEFKHEILGVGRVYQQGSACKRPCNAFWGMTLPDPAFTELVRSAKPEILVHCAGTASVQNSMADPYDDYRKTVEVCAFVLDTIHRHAPHCYFVLLSSGSVYGNPAVLPVTEKATVSPVSPYAYHKRIMEMLVEEYDSLHGVHGGTLRIFSAYGEGLRRQVIYETFRRFLEQDDQAVEFWGTGDESRDFVHARDVAQAVGCLVRTRSRGVFNVGAGVQTSIRELVTAVRSIVGSDRPFNFNGRIRAGDPRNWEADIGKLKALGFRPSVSLRNGLCGVYNWLLNDSSNKL